MRPKPVGDIAERFHREIHKMTKMDKMKCYDCGKEVELINGDWTITNVTFKDGLEVFMCDDCIKVHRRCLKQKDIS